MSDEVLKQIAKDVAAIKAALAAGAVAFGVALGAKLPSPAADNAKGGGVAPDAELDGQYGDPEVRRDPTEKYWTGDSFSGRKLSECTAEYLDAYAKYKDACAWGNDKDGSDKKKKYAEYDRRDAARARGWAARLRAGWKPKVTSGASRAASAKDEDYDDFGSGDSDIPF